MVTGLCCGCNIHLIAAKSWRSVSMMVVVGTMGVHFQGVRERQLLHRISGECRRMCSIHMFSAAWYGPANIQRCAIAP